ncbi:MAG: mechanosensitive ion channel family protein [Gemmatimonadota bacterium]|jgi:MscS family membrane protein|nr:mechanosensitive ion channel family protein [Gemmatimonadota bacterium]MDQ8147860.1 mechanosensitive ion channel family protein [Gemmatimonadota bacterium]MDQ8149504.1 mechanosensitive ion channel family protein [Gemmatimonadota bacterium]MDQ8157292.1 mechanosensitive ion channel family protein [Gemmatimonadota bacterium]MDQ8170931.1 mechanosensitive ion channel family protein [Gemmatimonadota bacterium]
MRLDWPLALLVLGPLSGAGGLLLAWPIQRLLTRIVRGVDVGIDDLLVAAARRPLALLLAAGVSRAALEWIRTEKAVQRVAVDVQGALAIVAVFWFLWRAIGVAQAALPAGGWAAQRPAFRSLIPLVARLGRIFVLVTGVLAVLASFGYEVATLLAGLGIGGIAIAFAAQKTLEHFFGSVAIGIDQPFRVGDTIVVDGIEGEVEAIGLRSTRLRTADRTVVSLPNGRLADMRTENLGPRDRFRFRTRFGLAHGTPAATVTRVRDAVEAHLRAEPLVWADLVSVRVVALAEASIDLEVVCWVRTTDGEVFKRVREGLLLGILRCIEGAGSTLAFPRQSVALHRIDDGGAP